ncbi:hypothetical protein SAMN04487944_1273 [Gracilibacillus ureilyticus]|uniref:Uncharacterized protein n=1 Tax=Gracilibacillus ureilyticus TaxID=531814 RepID=A0A1H9VSJ9_9BACI|nr:hypothetical protein [Gracilibacillus ureilyticus]SES24508.1 hypothetical protein SAMN04487944_1273 [Gracilibacillus ureilyticus]
MLMTIEKRNDLVKPENKLERLYFTNYLSQIKTAIEESNVNDSLDLDLLISFLKSGEEHSKGNYVQFPLLTTTEIYSLITKSLTTEQIIQNSVSENLQIIISYLERLDNLSEKEKGILVSFLSNIINNLDMPLIEPKRNYFDW